MPRWSRQEQHGVRKDSLNLPRFYSRIQVQSSSLPRFAFCSFTLWISPNFYVSPRCFWLLKWGWKAFGLPRYFGFHRDAFFCYTAIFLFFTAALFSTFHDTLVSTELFYLSTLHDSLFRPSHFIFRRFMIVYFLPSRFIFRCFTIVYFLPSRYIFRNFTVVYFFARTPFAKILLTPACAAGKRRHAFYAAVFQSAPRGVKQDSLNLPRFLSRIQIHFLFLPRLCFLLFHAL